jgi:branched-chain amino acid aminotransferase
MNASTLWKINADSENCTPNQIQLDGTVKTIDEISVLLPGGVYTTFRTYEHNKVLFLNKHFIRLEQSAALLNKKIHLDNQTLRCALHRVINTLDPHDLRIRITLDLEIEPGAIYISTEDLRVLPPEVYQNGGTAITYHIQRPVPGAKLTSHIEIAAEIRKQYDKNIVHEILIVNEENIILEGLSSNFFGVVDGTIRTAGKEILPGTLRAVALELADQLRIPVQYESVSKNDLALLDETFVTSTSRSILPVVEIDQTPIGDGKPGPVTRRLMAALHTWVMQSLEPV